MSKVSPEPSDVIDATSTANLLESNVSMFVQKPKLIYAQVQALVRFKFFF